MKESVVILGFLSHFPVAGVAWQTLHYLEGFRRLGYDVHYVEAHGCTPSKLMRSRTDDGPALAAGHLAGLLGRFGFGDRWAYHALYEGRTFGKTPAQLRDLFRSASLIINLHGSHVPTAELTATNRLVYLETDPVDVQVDLYHGRRETFDYLAPHCAFFTYGENLGRPGCLVPEPERFRFHPTRQPVILDFWEDHGAGPGGALTTVGNWRQPWRSTTYKGEVYSWSKHVEFHKVIGLPRRLSQPVELALSSFGPEDQELLESHGWRVRRADGFSHDLDEYRNYIGGSRGEFTVAKEQNVRLRSGWFSDRAATYLAAGRPVITQETGFSDILPVGEGLFGFTTMEDIVGAVTEINGDYERHQRGARRIAHECFSHDVVLTRMLRDLGITWPELARSQSAARARLERQGEPAPAIPPGLVVTPIGRWPTRLPEETLTAAAGMPVPSPLADPSPADPISGPTASLVMVTHNGLAYTRLCLASLLSADWTSGDELIVVDNGSTDGTPDYLEAVRAAHPWVQVILNPHNAGFAAANNQGLERAAGGVLILLNNDTLVPPGWRDGLVGHLADPTVGLVGPVTNRTCNEAQIDAPYHTHGGMLDFAAGRAGEERGRVGEIPMLAMFCVAFRREVWRRVGPLDEQFEIGMFEDDDYSRRIRAAGFRVVCAEDVFVHHFGQASLGELCATGDYDRVLAANRGRFELKWGGSWRPHGRRVTREYQQLRTRARELTLAHVPVGAPVVVISKGDEQLVDLDGRPGWHFPQVAGGSYSGIYPADGAGAVAELEALRASGARYFLVPQPASWWLEYYTGLRDHLARFARLVVRDAAVGSLYALETGGVHA